MQDHIDLLFDEICSTLATRFIIKIGLCSKAHLFNRRITNIRDQYRCYRYTYPSAVIQEAIMTKQYHWIYEINLKYPDIDIIIDGIISAIDYNDIRAFDILYNLYLDSDQKEPVDICLKSAIWKRNKYFVDKLTKLMTSNYKAVVIRASIITQIPINNDKTVVPTTGVKGWIWDLLSKLSDVNLDIPDINVAYEDFKRFECTYSNDYTSSSIVQYIADFLSYLLENEELQIHFVPRYKFLVEFYNKITNFGHKGFDLLMWKTLGYQFINTDFMTKFVNHKLFDEFIDKLTEKDQAIVFWRCRDLDRAKQLCTKYVLYYYGVISEGAKYIPDTFPGGHNTLGLKLTDYRLLTIAKLEWLANNPELRPVIDDHPMFSRMNLNLDELNIQTMLRICQYQEFNNRILFLKSLCSI